MTGGVGPMESPSGQQTAALTGCRTRSPRRLTDEGSFTQSGVGALQVRAGDLTSHNKIVILMGRFPNGLWIP